MTTEEKVEAWTCDKCGEPTRLELVVISLRTQQKRFRSGCCTATVTPTKALRPRIREYPLT